MVVIMPTIAKLSGITIRMNPKGKEHNPPHVHVIYENQEISFDIVHLVSRGWNFPKKQFEIAKSFIYLHREELLKMWDTQEFRLIENKEK